LSINYKIHTKKPAALNSEISELLNNLKNIQKDKYAFWYDAVGEKIAKVAVPVYNKKGVLMVRVEDSVWRFELTRRKPEIIENVNKNLNSNNKIKDIIFK
jgi:DNA-binding IclR family transcriptional regulator